MHIAFITPEFPRPGHPEGGLANYIRKTGLALIMRGHKVTVFCHDERDEQFEYEGIPVYACARSAKAPWWGRIARFQKYTTEAIHNASCQNLANIFWEVNSSTPIDVIQTSNYYSPAYTLLNNGQIPVICRYSCYQPLLRGLSGAQRYFSDYMYDWMDLDLVRSADARFSPSQFIADVYSRFESVEVDKVIHTMIECYEGEVDESLYHQHLESEKYLLYFGAFNCIKGVDLMAHAFNQISDAYPDLKLVLVGRDDSYKFKSSMQDYFKQHMSPEAYSKVLFFESQEQAALKVLIKNAELVLMPSRADNYPNACLEAFEQGAAVIGSTQSSLDEIIEDGQTGFICENGDAQSFALAIKKYLVLSDEEKAQMKKNVEKKVAQVLASEPITELLNFYEKTIMNFEEKR